MDYLAGVACAKRGLVVAQMRAWLIGNLAFAVVVVAAGLSGHPNNPRTVYLILLFGICSSVSMCRGGLSGRFGLLIILSGLVFVFYGAQDLVGVLVGVGFSSCHGALDNAELVILVGLVGLIGGYVCAARVMRDLCGRFAAQDWGDFITSATGLTLWLIGILATAYWQMVVQRVPSQLVSDLSPLSGLVLVLGRMVQPLGLALLAYQLAVYKTKRVRNLVVVIVLAEFAFGFAADSKELAIRGILIVIAAQVLVSAKLPKKAILVATVVATLTFPVFQAYRFEILQQRNEERIAAFSNLSASLRTALDSLKQSGHQGASSAESKFGVYSFLGRVSLKGTMEMLVERTGKSVRFQRGKTIALLFSSLIPRFVYANKPDTSVGRLFNREFDVSEDPDTYISATQLGELYWNFGAIGVAIGSVVIGLVIGLMGSLFALRDCRSVTRFLVLIVTLYYVCLRLEGSIALQYTVWVRSVVLALVMHFTIIKMNLGKGAPTIQFEISADEATDPNGAHPPNLME